MAGLPDVEAMATLERRAAHAPWSGEQLARSLALATSRAFVTEGPEGVLGHVLGSAVADEGEVLTLAVDPDARRRGLGTLLLGALEGWWRERGVTRGFLEVRVDNDAALALYARAGWRRVGLRRAYYGDGTDAAVLERAW